MRKKNVTEEPRVGEDTKPSFPSLPQVQEAEIRERKGEIIEQVDFRIWKSVKRKGKREGYVL